jgi:hypothetical protein
MNSMIMRLRKMPESNRRKLEGDCMAIFDGTKPDPIYKRIKRASPKRQARWKHGVIASFRRADMRVLPGGKKDGPQDSLKGEFNL